MSHTVCSSGTPLFTVNEGDTLLAAALRANIGFPHECSSGGCGACRFELLSGEVTELWPDAPGLSARDRKKNKLLACQCKLNSDLDIKVRTADEYLPAVVPARYQAEVIGLRDVTHDMRELTLKTEAAAHFRPGQYALLGIDSLDRPRAYSMSNQPNDAGIWQFIIRRVPGGLFTSRLFEQVTVGARITLDGPYGMAWFRPDAGRDVLCISGGSGFAPMRSIAEGAACGDFSGRIHFYFGARTPSDVFAASELEFLTTSPVSSRVKVAVSNPDPSWSGETGFIHEHVERDLGATLRDHEIYLAGPPPMVEAIQEMLFLRHQVPVQQVHLDRFY